MMLRACAGLPEPGNGDERKADRLARLNERRAVYVNRGRRALLIRLLSAGTATADDVRALVDLPDGIDPRCLGAVPGPLARAGIIALAGYVKAARPERHASVIARWRLADADAARRWLARHPDMPDPLADDDGGEPGTLFDLGPQRKQRPTAAAARR